MKVERYRVLVDRTVTQSLYVDVEVPEGASNDDIRDAATDAAADRDFNLGTTSEPQYEAVDIANIDPDITRPRP